MVLGISCQSATYSMFNLRSDEPIDAVLEKVMEHKCTQLKLNGTDPESVLLDELTAFERYLPNTIPSWDTIDRDIFVCRVMRIYIDEDLKALEKRCDWHEEKTIKYPGMEGEFKNLFGVSPDEVRRFFKYLSAVAGEIVRGETTSPDVLKGVFEIHGAKTEDGLKIQARHKNFSGTRILSAVRRGGEGNNCRFEIAPRSGC